jgi:hypothetical protein
MHHVTHIVVIITQLLVWNKCYWKSQERKNNKCQSQKNAIEPSWVCPKPLWARPEPFLISGWCNLSVIWAIQESDWASRHIPVTHCTDLIGLSQTERVQSQSERDPSHRSVTCQNFLSTDHFEPQWMWIKRHPSHTQMWQTKVSLLASNSIK